MDVLKDHSWHFEFDRLTLHIDASLPAGTGRHLQLDAVSHPYVEVVWPGASAQCVWDSGAAITVVDEAFRRRHPQLFVPKGTSTGTDATGTEVETQTLLMAEAEIGGERFAPHVVTVVDLSRANATLQQPMDLILGYPTLRQANWLFDFPSRRWAVTRSPR